MPQLPDKQQKEISEMEDKRFAEVDSEIALTALLAAGVTAYPTSANGFYILIKFLAFSLLLLTLIRRMAIMHEMSPESELLQISTHAMDTATYISLLYLVYALIEWSVSFNSAMEILPLVFSIITPLLVMGLFLGWEIVYLGPLKEGKRVFEATAEKHHGEFFGIVLSQVAGVIQNPQWEENRDAKQVTLEHFRTDKQNIEDYSVEELLAIGQNFLIFVVSMILPFVAYGGVVWLSGYLIGGGVGIRFLLLISTLVVSGLVRLWYSEYGFVKVEDRNGYYTFLGEATAYLIMCAILL